MTDEKTTLSSYHTGQSWGCFGEILQGILPNNRYFLITIPINIQSESTFYFEKKQISKDLQVYPPSKVKSKKFARLFLENYKLPVKGVLTIKSKIPEGKGLSSSTADLVATARALGAAFQIDYKPSELEPLIQKIEPSSGLLYSGMVIYFHREVALFKHFTYVPNLIIVALDEGGIVDTLEYNSRKLSISLQDKQDYEILLARFITAVETKDIREIGAIATKSAEINQKNNFKQTFNQLLRLNEEIQGVGIINTHSGTYLGIILDGQDPFLEEKINYCKIKYQLLGKEAHIFQTVSTTSPALSSPSL